MITFKMASSDEHVPPIPLDDYEYRVMLGESMFDTNDRQQKQGDVYATFGYEFQPASIDKSTPGIVSVDNSGSVQVLMASSTGRVSFKGKLVEHKETDCLLFFDGSGFRLEHCPFSCLQLRHVRAPAPRRHSQIQSTKTTKIYAHRISESKEGGLPAAPEITSSLETDKKPVGRPRRVQNKRRMATSKGSITATSTAKRLRGRPKDSTKAAMKMRQDVETRSNKMT
ncbi:Protein associated with transcriptional elongation factor ELL [Plasmopara halstedii]|uniref:Protein associated with transcriptional elongation factor ELL n=1 Tax=Plasmopara halstedii TaxID=4781 RepID=A0A0P1ADC4_PLAHL|nr:Protein associated with transcriptional elongation factor ELL [Plasmopara halstedii]CEG38305.1 Protein associated with transcriptional elongation factor ELL [Plasmopara halstedii]|eukprot:XP_024574674.1 Protein associated with transcriptional elongation factor ELL [Plasmopara halstedii]